VEVRTMRDVYELLAPVSSFTHKAFETVEEELVELIRFIENVVEASLKNDAKVQDGSAAAGAGGRGMFKW